MPHAPDHPYRRGAKQAPTPPAPRVRSTLHAQLAELLSDVLGIEDADARLDAHITSDLNADSLDTIELTMVLEERFSIPEDALDDGMETWFERDGTVKELIAMVQKATQ